MFKALHVQDLVAIWLKSGLKRAAYARLGRAGAAAKHARRRRLAGEFLGHYAWRAFSW